MKDKLIKGVPNYLFNSIKEYRNLGISKKIIKNGRMANEGDWTYTDDGYICQILKKSKVSHPRYKTPRTMVRTVCGTFICEQKTHSILGKKGIAQNIYSFSGNYKASYSFSKDRKLKTREFLFIKYIRNYIYKKKINVKSLLMNQKFVGGIGNIYANEILYCCKLRPTKTVNQLSKKNILNIILQARKVLDKAIMFGGSSIRDFKKADGVPGNFQKNFTHQSDKLAHSDLGVGMD